MAVTGHFVDFFDTDEEFTTAAVTFLKQGFDVGSACMAIFTPHHTRMLQSALTDAGVNPDVLVDDYRFVMLDAIQTTNSLMADDRIDIREFFHLTGDLIRLLAAGGRDVYIAGEIANVLAADGRIDALVQLEELSNDLSREHHFQMYCLYCENAFSAPLDVGARRKICAAHSGSLRTS
jgi:hypothetical protein